MLSYTRFLVNIYHLGMELMEPKISDLQRLLRYTTGIDTILEVLIKKGPTI